MIKHDEEFAVDGLSDEEFLSKVGSWVDRADSHYAKTGNGLVFVGRQIIGRLLRLAEQ